MTQSILILITIIMANIPWMFSDFLFIKKFPSHKKPFSWALFEVVILYFITGGILLFAEHKMIGHIQSQAWEFYAVTFFLFLVFSFLLLLYFYFSVFPFSLFVFPFF